MGTIYQSCSPPLGCSGWPYCLSFIPYSPLGIPKAYMFGPIHSTGPNCYLGFRPGWRLFHSPQEGLARASAIAFVSTGFYMCWNCPRWCLIVLLYYYYSFGCGIFYFIFYLEYIYNRFGIY